MITNAPEQLAEWITPFQGRTYKEVSYDEPIGDLKISGGMSHTGYDVSLAAPVCLMAWRTTLAVTMETIKLPSSHEAVIYNKSTWARLGVSFFHSTTDPGFHGQVTLEITYTPLVGYPERLYMPEGVGACLLKFRPVSHHVWYDGKYKGEGLEYAK